MSAYTQKDILEAFRQKIKEGHQKTRTMQDVHESYQIVRRVMNSKRKFATFGKGAVKSEKITGLLATLKEEGEEERKREEKKKQMEARKNERYRLYCGLKYQINMNE